MRPPAGRRCRRRSDTARTRSHRRRKPSSRRLPRRCSGATGANGNGEPSRSTETTSKNHILPPFRGCRIADITRRDIQDVGITPSPRQRIEERFRRGAGQPGLPGGIRLRYRDSEGNDSRAPDSATLGRAARDLGARLVPRHDTGFLRQPVGDADQQGGDGAKSRRNHVRPVTCSLSAASAAAASSATSTGRAPVGKFSSSAAIGVPPRRAANTGRSV